MPKVRDVCSQVRSKNAGPFWITIDTFFDGEDPYRRYRDDVVFTPGLKERTTRTTLDSLIGPPRRRLRRELGVRESVRAVR